MADDDFFEVPNLVVDEELSSDSDASQEPEVKKACGKALKYEVLHAFKDEVAFNRWWDVERNLLWIYQTTHTNKSEDVETWFCKKNERYAGKMGYKCLARLRIHIDMQSRDVQPTSRCPELFYECSCRQGSKKEVCQHATMVMCGIEKIVAYSAEATAAPMKGNRPKKKSVGRVPLAPRQHPHDVAD